MSKRDRPSLFGAHEVVYPRLGNPPSIVSFVQAADHRPACRQGNLDILDAFERKHARRLGKEGQSYLTDGMLTVGRDMSLFHCNI
ncbi:inositol hexakisphosphate kinase [Pseudozyma hubeiensis SY62]|uniref:Inositol hexakisphosphate kinase n=1 Tax=Pseudozyma hubeiensis (strain SY62) TaxID=1305764 RepID=R9P4I4_PSEHS|nr:inositol hexakisphosphate kinase [Pseudozyma hubeiensis SY62]GAC96167.1 inositol hexakisphosphate kinase [Pseudozyma hubeiensis SY62]